MIFLAVAAIRRFKGTTVCYAIQSLLAMFFIARATNGRTHLIVFLNIRSVHHENIALRNVSDRT